MKRNVKIIVVFFVLLFLILITRAIHSAYNDNIRGLKEHLPTTHQFSLEDSDFISKKHLGQLSKIEVHNSKVREPISVAVIDNKYKLLIYKIDLIKDTTFKDIFHTEIKNEEISTGYTYLVVAMDYFFKFNYQAGQTKAASNIYFTLTGDSIQTIAKNDSELSYHLLCKNFSIRYAENSPVDICVTGKEGAFGISSTAPMDIFFLKHHQAVYLLVMTSDNPKIPLPPALGSMVKQKRVALSCSQ